MQIDLKQFGLGRCALLVLLVATPLVGCRGNKSPDPPVHLNQNMDFQQKFEAQEENPWFTNGRAMRGPVPGTVSRGLNANAAMDYLGYTVPSTRLGKPSTEGYFTGLTPEGRRVVAQHTRQAEGKPASELNPPKVEASQGIDGLPSFFKDPDPKKLAALLKRGEERFNIFCTPCHGVDGYGKGSVALLAGDQLSVPSYHGPTAAEARDVRTYPLGYIYHVINHGVGRMESYASQIPAPDRWAIASWVRTLQRSQTAKGGN